MTAVRLFLVFLALFGTVAQCAPVTNGQSIPAPALLWGTKNYFGDESTRVSYETVSFVELWSNIVEGWLNKGVSETKMDLIASKDLPAPTLTVLFIGQQLRASDFGALGSSPALEPLKKAVEKSSSMLALPNTIVEGPSLNELVAAMTDTPNVDVEVLGSCGVNDDAEVDLRTELDQIASKIEQNSSKVVVVCGSGGLLNEMEDFGTVTEVLDTVEGDHLILYVSDLSSQESELTGKRRSLLAAAPSFYEECDQLCLTQVKFLEGIILALILALAMAAGLCCLHILDSPTQFEKPNED